MSGFEIVGVIVSAVPIVAKVIKHFGSQRNAPRQVERLSRILAELQDERLQRFAKPEEQKNIHDMVNRCTDILERETTSQKGRVWKFFWSADAEKQLKEHNDELENELDRILRRVHLWAGLPTTPPATGSSSAGAPEIRTPPPYSSPVLEAQAFVPPPSSSPYLEAKAVVRPPSTLSAPGSPPIPFLGSRRNSRRGSVEALELPTTLCLQNPYGQRIGERLKLKTLTILERDDTWRRIQYVGHGLGGVEIRITHRIPRGNIWFEDEDMEDRSVSFLEPHDITVQNAEGYKVYRAYSLYEFGTVEHRELFLVNVRERELLGRYFAEKIWERGELIAQQKVVRLWKKKVSDIFQKTTLSFIGRDQKPYERPLTDFHRSPTLQGDRVELVDGARGVKTTLEFRPQPRVKPARGKWKFGSKSKVPTPPATPDAGAIESDAARFKAAFEASHPSTSTWNPQALPLSPIGFEPLDTKEFTPRASTPSPCLPELVLSTSRAPTLSTISVPSAYLSIFPDETDRPASPTEKDIR